MPSDRKVKSHIVGFTKERYKPLKVEESKTTDISLPGLNDNFVESSLEDRLKSANHSMGKYRRSVQGLNNKLGMEEQPSEHYRTDKVYKN